MLKLIKMDLYRMFHTKAFYVVWIFLAATIAFSTVMTKEDYKYMQEEAAKGQLESVSEGNLNVGLNVTIPTKPGEKVTVFDQVFANMQSKLNRLIEARYPSVLSTRPAQPWSGKGATAEVPEKCLLLRRWVGREHLSDCHKAIL